MIKFQGPIPGGNLPQCAVLRCDHEGAYVTTVETGSGREPERLVCNEHKQAIDAGERWQWDAEQSVFLMGEDLKGEGRLEVETFHVRRASDVDSEFGVPLRVDVEDADGVSLGFVLSLECAYELGRMLVQFSGRDQRGS